MNTVYIEQSTLWAGSCSPTPSPSLADTRLLSDNSPACGLPSDSSDHLETHTPSEFDHTPPAMDWSRSWYFYSVLDLDSGVFWIRIRFRNPDPGAYSVKKYLAWIRIQWTWNRNTAFLKGFYSSVIFKLNIVYSSVVVPNPGLPFVTGIDSFRENKFQSNLFLKG